MLIQQKLLLLLLLKTHHLPPTNCSLLSTHLIQTWVKVSRILAGMLQTTVRQAV
jgi:hypothetical protein